MANRICKACNRSITINLDGALRAHKANGVPCIGSRTYESPTKAKTSERAYASCSQCGVLTRIDFKGKFYAHGPRASRCPMSHKVAERALSAPNATRSFSELKVGDIVSVGGSMEERSMGVVIQIDGDIRHVAYVNGQIGEFKRTPTPLFKVTHEQERAARASVGLEVATFTPAEVARINNALKRAQLGAIHAEGNIYLRPYGDSYVMPSGKVDMYSGLYSAPDNFAVMSTYEVLHMFYRALNGEHLEPLDCAFTKAVRAHWEGRLDLASMYARQEMDCLQLSDWHHAPAHAVQLVLHKQSVLKKILIESAHTLGSH